MKKYYISILAILLAIGMNSFTSKNKEFKAFAGTKWYHFFGDIRDAGQVADTAYYELDEGTGFAPTICTSPCHSYRCEILIAPMPGYPDKPDLAGGVVFYQTSRSTF